MCFSLVSLGGIPITILDPGCTRKTYPRYFEDFASLAGISPPQPISQTLGNPK